MKKKRAWLIPALLLLALAAAIAVYTRPMQLSQLCGTDCTDIGAFHVTYETYPENEPVSCRIGEDDPRFLPLTLLLTEQRYRRSVWSIFPPTTKTHVLRDGDYKWELGLELEDAVLPGGETVSGTVVHLSDFYGALEIRCLEKSWRCTVSGQESWIADVMEAIRAE